MKGPALMGLFADMATGNSDETDVLEGTCCDLEGDIQVSPGTRADAVDKLLERRLVGRLGGAGGLRVGRSDGDFESEDFESERLRLRLEPGSDEAPAFFLP